MFAFGGSAALLAGRHDSAQERPPPELPTPVTFPSFEPPQRPRPWTPAASTPALFDRFALVRKPSDVGLDHFSALNVSLEPACHLEEMLAALPDGPSCLPPKEWTAMPTADAPSTPEEGPKRLLADGRPYPGRDEFVLRLKELVADNHEAFSALTRAPLKDKKPPRLAHFRRFFEGLDNMAYYWDTSLDEYMPPQPEANPTTGSNRAGEQKAGEAAKPEARHTDESEPRKKAKTAPFAPGMSINLAQRPATAPSRPGTTDSKPAGSYKGLRIGTGREMPESYRMDTVRSFVEPLAWSFGMSLSQHRRPPMLQLQSLRVPVRVSTVLWRSSADRFKARQGFLHGPAAGIRVGDYVDFDPDGDGERAQQEALLDVMREIGSLLCIAQERAREGRSERRPGQGEWWTSVPRWGGGAGGDVGEARGDGDGPASKAKEAEKEGERVGRSAVSRKSAAKKKSAAEAWAELKPGASLWDPKVEYEAIGKDKRSEWDDVFTVSALNTHLSLLHLRVHRAYLSWLETGELPSPPPADTAWCRPILHRTRWYDLFSVEDRVEAMRGIWGLMAWLARPQDEPKGSDVAMKNA